MQYFFDFIIFPTNNSICYGNVQVSKLKLEALLYKILFRNKECGINNKKKPITRTVHIVSLSTTTY